MKKLLSILIMLLILAYPLPCMASFMDEVKEFEAKYNDIYGQIDPALAVTMESFLQAVVDQVADNYNGGDLNKQINDTVMNLLLGDPRYNQDLLNYLAGQMNNQEVYQQQIREMKAIVRRAVEAKLAAKTNNQNSSGGSSGGGSSSGTTTTSTSAPAVTTNTGQTFIEQSINANSQATVKSSDARLQVNIPQNALSEDARMVITLVPAAEQIAAQTGKIQIGNLQYKIEAVSKQGNIISNFKQSLSLDISYNDTDIPAGTDENDLKICCWNDKVKNWIALPTSVDINNNKLSSQTNHFSIFAVMAFPGFPALNDCKGHWAESDIIKLASLGIASGDPSGNYRPEANITRQEFAIMVVKAVGLQPDNNMNLSFSDSGDISAWAAPFVSAAVKAGIISGYSDNTFRAQSNINRAEIATMLIRAQHEQVESQPQLNFIDNNNIPQWAGANIARAVQLGIVSGFPDGSFQAGARATRAQAARMVSSSL